MASRQPPYFFPSNKKTIPNANCSPHANKSANIPALPKKRTSSAPVRNPAPTVVPMRKKAARMVPIHEKYDI